MSALGETPTAEAASDFPSPQGVRSSLRVLVIDGHPRDHSLGSAIARVIQRGAASRVSECRSLLLRDLRFDPCAQGEALEQDLRDAQQDVLWAQVVVFVYPTWWGTVPALLKGFLDRILHPGFAFVERSGGGWKSLLDGRAALLVTTMDTPHWIYRWLLRAPGDRAMRDATLGFCGIKPVKILSFGPVRTSTFAQRRRWLARVALESRRLETTFRTGWRVKLRAWLAASRLHFYVQPWLAYTLGALALTVGGGHAWSWPGYLLGYSMIFVIEFITVITNELADFESDRMNGNSSALTGGSRVLVTGRLTADELRRGRRFAFAVLAVVGLCAFFVPHAWPLIVIGTLGLVLGMGYSAPPLRFCAKGLGEMDVAFTHSFLVIVAGFLSQGGSLHSSTPWLLALPLYLAVFPSIILAGFPDFEADEATDKRTLAVRIRRRRAAILAGACAMCAAFVPLLLTGPASAWLRWTSAFAIPHAAWLTLRIYRFVQSGSPPGRIDALLILALTFMLWFCLVPLFALLLSVR